MGSDLNTTLAKKNGVIKEFLVTGKEVTAQLQMLMKKPCWRSDENKHLVDELMGKITSSYDQSLLVLKSDGDEVFHQDLMTNSHHVSNGFDDEGRGGGVYEESSESKKIPAVKDKRGCYKRRKSGDTWARVSPTTEDEYAWRKYGQKAILNCKYPRSYFRCTHKYDQGCKATKQVQRMEDKPDQYHTTYIGVHTCKEITKAPLMISDSYDQKHLESILVFSQTSSKIPKPQPQQHHYIKPFPNPTTSSTTFIKEEGKEDTNSDLTDNNNVSSMDSYMPNEFMSIESAEPTTITSRIMGDDAYDVPHWISNVDDDFFETYFGNNNM